MTRRGPDDIEFLAGVTQGLALPRRLQRSPDPFGNRHVARARHTLDFPILGILQNHLQSLSHLMSLNDSSL